MATTSVTIRMDENLKKQAEKLFDEMGLNMSSAITVFAKAVVREKGIPFELTTKVDPFYSAENLKVLRQAIRDAEEGKLTPHDLLED